MNRPLPPLPAASPIASSASPAIRGGGASRESVQVDDFEGEVRQYLRRSIATGFWVVLLGFVVFLLWAFFVPLDEGVPSPGTVVIETKRKAVQHQQGGLVSEVLVKEGQWVEQGAVLLRLDGSAAMANLQSARQSRASLNENRLAQRAVLEGLLTVGEYRKKQQQLLEKELQGLRQVVNEGYAPASQLYQLERSLGDLQSSMADLLANQQKARQSILDLDHQLLAADERLRAAQTDFDRLSILAPVSGQVVDLGIASAGGVLQPAERIMEIVPTNEFLLIEARVQPQYIDRIREGGTADVRFSAYANSPQLVAPGVLQSVSADALLDAATQQSHYLARVQLTQEGLSKLDGRALQPGMPVEVVLKTGSRTLLQYLLHPLSKRLAASMKEE